MNFGSRDEPVQCEIVLPVYNALSQTARCIESVLSRSSLPFRLVIVNDSSDSETTAYLRQAAARDRRIVLLENEKNLGFLHTANRGMRYGLESEGGEGVSPGPEFKVVLNSDTVVTEGWLESFERCFASDPSIGLATPVSNNAENLSIAIPAGYNLNSLSALFRKNRIENEYPDIATAIGFCMGVRTSVLREVGCFDEIFAPGYAEDSDYHFRVLCGAYRSVLLTDCFIYHESHASFSEKKQALVQRNRPIFDQRWSTIYANELEYHDSLAPLRRLQSLSAKSSPLEHDVLFLLPTSKLFGGVIVVYELVNRLISRGMDANVVVLSEEAPIEMDLLFTPYFLPDGKWRAEIPKAKAYVATHFETSPFAFEAHAQHPDSKLLYLVQGYESWFPGARVEDVVHTYRAIPNRIAVSGWLEKMLARWGCDSTKIPNGVDTKFFYPSDAPRAEGAGPSLLVMLRDDPQGGWRIAFDLIRRSKIARPALRVIAVGNLSEEPSIKPLCAETHLSANRKLMREIYRRSDMFLDCSMVQGFGMMGLEAMASGTAVILARTGGVAEYSNDENALLCELGDTEAMYQSVLRLVDDPALLERLKKSGRASAEAFEWEKTVDLYERRIRSAIESGNEVEACHHREMGRYLFQRSLTARSLGTKLIEARNVLMAELDGPRRGALDLFSELGRRDIMDALVTSQEGLALLHLYETARHKVLSSPRARQTPDAPAEGLLGAVMRNLAPEN